MLRAYKFRIYPSRLQEIKMEQVLEICRTLYNNSLAERKSTWETEKRTITYREQQSGLPLLKEKEQELQLVHSQVLQDVLRRLDKAFQNFFRRMKNGEKPGYPRFKAEIRYNSFTYPQFGKGYGLLDGALHISKLGRMRMFRHREIKGGIKTCTISRDVNRWYACFLVELPEPAPVKKQPKNRVGVDVGLESLITLNSGERIEPPRFLKRMENKLAIEQHLLSRKRKGSANRSKQRMKVAKVHRKVREQRKDFNHMLSRFLIENYDSIAFEDLRVRDMMQNGFLAKQIADASWSQLMLFTQYKAEEAGAWVEFVDARNTTQACSRCGAIVHKGLNERIHRCPSCGLVLGRDTNAARNILSRATLGPRGSACRDLQEQVSEAGSPTL